MCGTIKDDILEDDDYLPKLLTCSIYDTEPVHILTNLTDKITRNTNKSKI